MDDSGSEEERLYVVYWEDADARADFSNGPSIFALGDTLVLIRTSQTRSQLYHAVKRRLAPRTLFVAALDDDPKFMGMNAGALKWVRGGAA